VRIFVKLFFGAACVSLVGVLTASCAETGCEGPGTCPPPVGPVADADGGGNEGGADVIAPPGCDLTKGPKDSPGCVDDAVGVFVSPTGDDGAAGTKAAPVKSVGKAVTLAGGSGRPRVYVCEGKFAESVSLTKSISIFGGLACGSFDYTGIKATLQSTDGTLPALQVGASNITIADLILLGPEMGAPNSVAVKSVGAKLVVFERTRVEARSGAKGAAGTRTDFGALPSQVDLNAGNAGDASGATGGAGKEVTCPGGLKSKGGKGGDNGFSGDPGTPALGGGAGGLVGQACAGTGTGGDGSTGATVDGVGAAKLGGLVQNDWIPEPGVAGPNGGPGQGGGGGQGVGGGGGGGGGAGGCGGAGGGGGKGGGASIAVLSVDSELQFRSSEIVAGGGGGGGGGAAGQTGQQIFGFGGNKTGGGCGGGNGGKGGTGGAGGGGAGGLSAGVLHKGSQPTFGATPITKGGVGPKGSGGGASNDGAGGSAVDVMAVQ